ncbi:MAG: hypothetical protein IPG95_00470 [Saprospiraceae bacterium]|nr:hypothetical protein [Saprospiraceae bacterium]
MCGPLALGVVGLQTNPKKKLRTALEYNLVGLFHIQQWVQSLV